MCVICVKSQKVEKPTSNILERMYTANDDLSGVSYYDTAQDVIITYRGLTLEALLQVNESIPQDTRAVYHCRIGTTGVTGILNSHPFPLGCDYTASKIVSKYPTLAHNGIIRGIGSKDESDTLTLVRKLGSLELPTIRFILSTFANNSTNKFALFTLEKTYLYGTFQELDGLQFSNLYFNIEKWTYIPYQSTVATTQIKPFSYFPSQKYCVDCKAELWEYEVTRSTIYGIPLLCDDCYEWELRRSDTTGGSHATKK